MAKIVTAKTAGFCFGVDRAVKLVYKTLEEKGNAATLGPIIHNTDAVNDMKSKGARIIESPEDVKDGETLILRSHGVSKDVYEYIKKHKIDYVDTACPFVSKIHKIVSKKTDEGYFILIAGDKSHPEVEAIMSYCENNCFAFHDDSELLNFFQKNQKNLQKPLAIVAQTTYNIILWDKCLNLIKHYAPGAVVYNTICNATQERQTEAEELSKQSDLMIIVGGKHSSNTKKLYEVCAQNCKSVHIERADELKHLDLNNVDRIGITAGASTPAHIIKEVQATMADALEKQGTEEKSEFEELLEQSLKKVHTGERVKGTVVKVEDNEIVVDIGTKHTGYVSLNELTDDPTKKPSDIVKEGDEIDLIVLKIDDQAGTVQLSKKKVDELVGFDEIVKAKDEDKILEGTVQRVVKGGVLVSSNGVRVFIPASQTGAPRNVELDTLLNTNVKFKILEVNESRRRAVGSIKAVLKEEQDKNREKFWENAEIGKTYKGEVKSITNYGAFVDLGGIDGMVHISELSWKRIKHPSEVVKVGDYIEVYIKDLDREKGRISLGYKKTEDNPWVKFQNEYKVGDIIDAKIVSITPFGAFAQIIDGVDGLIHISQLADRRVNNVKDVVSIGDVVKVKILDIDVDKKRISISMRAAQEDLEKDADADADKTEADSEE